jgi:hypothetical protein
MYSSKDGIDKAYAFIQNLISKNYKYIGTPVYNVTKADLTKLAAVGAKYGIPLEWLFNLIKNESASTFNPAITNSIGATGLIQFMTTIGNKRMTYAKADGSSPVDTSVLRKMTFSEQLDYVDGFLKRNLKRYLNSEGKLPDNFTQGDIFMTIFYPAAIGKPNYQFPNFVSVANGGIQKPLDYVNKTLKNAVFPLSVFPYTLAEVKEKFGEIVEQTKEKIKKNILPTILIICAMGFAGYMLYKNVKIK